MPHTLIHPPHTPLLIVISGPSGVGKDTVLQRMKERGLPFLFVVTATTRPQRAGEVEAARGQVRASGMWFVDDLDQVAWNYAKRYADRFMFQPGAASFGGKRFQKLSPFGPATTDFLTRTGMILTDSAAVGWRCGKNPKYLSLPFSKGQRALPLNLRVLGRAAAIGGRLRRRFRKQQREGVEDPDFKGPPHGFTITPSTLWVSTGR